MTEDDLKAVIAKYQQKSFELFNTNIVLETQVEKLQATVNFLSSEVEKLNKNKKDTKSVEDFE